jgi:hypothetical protein
MLLLQPHESSAINFAQSPPSQTTPDNARHHISESQSVINLAGVESKNLLIDVALEVEGRDLDVRSFDAAFKQRPKILNAVGVYFTANIFFGVVDRVVNELGVQSGIEQCGISVEVCPAFDVRQDDRVQFACLGCRNNLGSHFPAALEQAVNDSLSNCATSANLFLANMRVHVAGLTADKGFVGFDRAGQLAECAGGHCFADSVKHEPCCFLSDAKGAAKLMTADAVFRVSDAPDGRKPFVQTERAILENRADLVAELLFAGAAFENVPRRNFPDVFSITFGTDDLAVGPFDQTHIGVADFEVRKIADGRDKIGGNHGSFLSTFFAAIGLVGRNKGISAFDALHFGHSNPVSGPNGIHAIITDSELLRQIDVTRLGTQYDLYFRWAQLFANTRFWDIEAAAHVPHVLRRDGKFFRDDIIIKSLANIALDHLFEVLCPASVQPQSINIPPESGLRLSLCHKLGTTIRTEFFRSDGAKKGCTVETFTPCRIFVSPTPLEIRLCPPAQLDGALGRARQFPPLAKKIGIADNAFHFLTFGEIRKLSVSGAMPPEGDGTAKESLANGFAIARAADKPDDCDIEQAALSVLATNDIDVPDIPVRRNEAVARIADAIDLLAGIPESRNSILCCVHLISFRLPPVLQPAIRLADGLIISDISGVSSA